MPPDRTPDTGLPSEKADCPTCGAPKGKPPAGPCDDTYHASPDRIRGDGGLGEAVGYDFEDGVRCVVMHCCGFTFDAVHTDEDGGYSCPACAEISPGRLAEVEQRAQGFATKWADEIEKRQAAERQVEALREELDIEKRWAPCPYCEAADEDALADCEACLGCGSVVQCKTCNGMGGIGPEGDRNCPDCSGDGVDEQETERQVAKANAAARETDTR
jgi:hypothetical protein